MHVAAVELLAKDLHFANSKRSLVEHIQTLLQYRYFAFKLHTLKGNINDVFTFMTNIHEKKTMRLSSSEGAL